MNTDQTPFTPLAVSLRDFTKITSISRSSAYVLIRDGKLKVTKIGGHTVVPFSEAQRLVQAAA